MSAVNIRQYLGLQDLDRIIRAAWEAMSMILEKLHLKNKPADGQAPKEPTSEALDATRQRYAEAKQDHVFAFWDHLSSREKAELYVELDGIDPKRINHVVHEALHPEGQRDSARMELNPLPDSSTASIVDADSEIVEQWYKEGLELVAKGQVAVVLMAGGQGTRLGSADPKGCFNIGLPSQKSLFQIQAERIRKVQDLAQKSSDHDSVIIPWYIMTSGPTRAATEGFFLQHHFFGLSSDNVIFFEQGVLPCVSNEGKILMEKQNKVAVAPDGNGGLYRALQTSNITVDMRKRGIQHIHAYCVDNCLVRVADPTFIGFAASKNVDIATKVVRKRDAKESVGLILQKNGKPDVVEYSEISADVAEAKDPKNANLLKFRAANIVNHYYSFQFLESIPKWVHKLPHHVAKKKIPCVDLGSGDVLKPDKPNGIKLEQFVFDVFPMLELDRFACLEVNRLDEFSPLKNARGTGEDDSDTSKQDILQQGLRWAEAAGATVESEEHHTGIEISPLMSYVSLAFFCT